MASEEGENQVSSPRISLSDPDSDGRLGHLGVGGVEVALMF